MADEIVLKKETLTNYALTIIFVVIVGVAAYQAGKTSPAIPVAPSAPLDAKKCSRSCPCGTPTPINPFPPRINDPTGTVESK